MSKKDQRIKRIIDLLQVKNIISIKELSKHLPVSEMTIRTDLSLLSNDNLVELIPGGAILKPNKQMKEDEEKYLITHEETQRTREKAKIGRKAASMIEPHDTIILVAGSTTEYIA
jgi:DeoR family deoxyribose operon repressor